MASDSQWMGGYGTLILVIWALPYLGFGGAFKASRDGPENQDLFPQLSFKKTLIKLLTVYLVISLLCSMTLFISGLPLFESVCYTMSTVSTGGFLVQSEGPLGSNKWAIEIILMLFMILGAMNFILHGKALSGSLGNYTKLLYFNSPTGKAKVKIHSHHDFSTFNLIFCREDYFYRKKHKIILDIGSNIGGFSFIASLYTKDIKVFSFDPNMENFYAHLSAVKKNKIKNIFPLNLALNNINEFNYFKYDNTYAGSKGTFGEELKSQLLKLE